MENVYFISRGIEVEGSYSAWPRRSWLIDTRQQTNWSCKRRKMLEVSLETEVICQRKRRTGPGDAVDPVGIGGFVLPWARNSLNRDFGKSVSISVGRSRPCAGIERCDSDSDRWILYCQQARTIHR